MMKHILKFKGCPGDIILLTAAIRDLHWSYPDLFQTDVRTPFRELWLHNPYLTALDEEAPGVETIECAMPLVYSTAPSRSNIKMLAASFTFQVAI